MQFSVGNDHISFPDEIEYYNVIWSRLCRSRNEYIELFIKNCDNLGSAQNLVSSGNELGLKYLDSVFVSFDDIFIKTGMYDFNARYLRQHYLYSHIIKEYCDTIEEIKNALDAINQKRDSVYRARDISKNTRPRVVGGGFGVANAVKGILIAESINLAVGAIHGGFNFICIGLSRRRSL